MKQPRARRPGEELGVAILVCVVLLWGSQIFGCAGRVPPRYRSAEEVPNTPVELPIRHCDSDLTSDCWRCTDWEDRRGYKKCFAGVYIPPADGGAR